MTNNNNMPTLNMSEQPNAKLIELTERLTGKWQIKGPEIDGKAEFRAMKEGFLLVVNVDFVVNGTKMKNIQQITYDQNTDTLRCRYMDTMGDYSTYIWVLEDQKFRVSLDDKNSDTYFEATFNDDNSEYSGAWHFPFNSDPDAKIVYKRIK